MQGVHEVHPDSLETLVTDGMELPYVEYGEMEPAVKLVYEGEDYWYYRTLPLKGYGAVMARHIRGLQAEGAVAAGAVPDAIHTTLPASRRSAGAWRITPLPSAA
jgi:hypothetical protein